MLEGWIPECSKDDEAKSAGAAHPRDPDKIDASYQYIRNREQQYADIAIEAEVEANANAEPVTLPDTEPVAYRRQRNRRGPYNRFEVKPDKDAEGVRYPGRMRSQARSRVLMQLKSCPLAVRETLTSMQEDQPCCWRRESPSSRSSEG